LLIDWYHQYDSFNSFLIISKEAVDKTTTSFDSYYLLYVSYA